MFEHSTTKAVVGQSVHRTGRAGKRLCNVRLRSRNRYLRTGPDLGHRMYILPRLILARSVDRCDQGDCNSRTSVGDRHESGQSRAPSPCTQEQMDPENTIIYDKTGARRKSHEDETMSKVMKERSSSENGEKRCVSWMEATANYEELQRKASEDPRSESEVRQK